jgi:hypothetical protein
VLERRLAPDERTALLALAQSSPEAPETLAEGSEALSRLSAIAAADGQIRPHYARES